MKKNISINISGIIFHIEEDGYETLRKYLDSVSKYFSSFEDSTEIMADIESRIAEIFLSKLNEGKQVITAEDVNFLMTTMGSVNDFKAAEQEFDNGSASSQQEKSEQHTYSPPKQLLRDQKRKTLGGVCAGLGSYLNVDPVWIRLLFALLGFAYGITILAYIIMWIVVPGSYDVEEPEVTKKMFRSPDQKVLGGVSGGVAAFLGIDIVLVRVLFIAFTFAGGIGVITYVVLWLVLPEAKTLTDKMQMQGEPVTLSNIESALKKNQNLNGNEDETTLTKILLFPFRLIAILLSALAKVAFPLADVLRMAIGIAIMLVGVGLIVSVIISGGILFGLLSGISLPHWFGPHFSSISFPFDIMKNTFPTIAIIAAFVAVFIPSLFVLLLGTSFINKRMVVGTAGGWALFGLFLASVIVLAVSIPRFIHAFKEDGAYKLEKTFTPSGKAVYLKVNDTGLEDYNVTSLTLKGYDGNDLKLEQTFEAQGNTTANAIENAHMVSYHVDFADSILTFDSNIQFTKDAKFRAQRLDMILYIPYDRPFVMNEDASRFITQIIDHENLDGQTWTMTKKGLTCMTCPKPNQEEDDDDHHVFSDGDLTDFDAVHINGSINATIVQGDEYAVEFIGDESEKEKYNVHKRGETLVISFDNDDEFFWKKKKFNFSEMKINITMPELKELELKGAGKLTISNFEADNLDISVMGAMDVRGEDLNVNDLSILVNGASAIRLSGHGENMHANVVGASKLNADDFEVTNATVEAHGVSNVDVNVTGTLEIEQSFTSDVDYSGNPKVVKKN